MEVTLKQSTMLQLVPLWPIWNSWFQQQCTNSCSSSKRYNGSFVSTWIGPTLPMALLNFFPKEPCFIDSKMSSNTGVQECEIEVGIIWTRPGYINHSSIRPLPPFHQSQVPNSIWFENIYAGGKATETSVNKEEGVPMTSKKFESFFSR